MLAAFGSELFGAGLLNVNVHTDMICTRDGWLHKINQNKDRGLVKNVGPSRPSFCGAVCLQERVRE